MDLLITPVGGIRCIYGEAIDLSTLGKLTIRRASHVEPDSIGRWWADLSPSNGPLLGPFIHRSQALAAEAAWLNDWLPDPAVVTPNQGDTQSCESNC